MLPRAGPAWRQAAGALAGDLAGRLAGAVRALTSLAGLHYTFTLTFSFVCVGLWTVFPPGLFDDGRPGRMGVTWPAGWQSLSGQSHRRPVSTTPSL